MKQTILAMAAVILVTAPAGAEVTNTADNGFTVQHVALINAPAAEVWKSLIAPAKWWSGEHTFSGNAENLYLVPQAGGCFCELIRETDRDNIKSAAGSVQHMRAIFVSNEKALRLSGALGPLQGEAMNGTLTIELQPEGDKTGMRFTYKVGGYMELPIDKIAPAVDSVIGEQLSRLSALFANDPEPETGAGVDDEVTPDDESQNDTPDESEEEPELN